MAEARQVLQFSGTRCEACGQPRPEGALDEQGWCAECRRRSERRVKIGQHLIAAAIVLPFAIWVLVLEKSAFLPWYAWLLPLAAAYYLGQRIGRESIKGYIRWRRIR
jgi:hypothetical protein